MRAARAGVGVHCATLTASCFALQVWSSSSDPKRITDDAATAAARADWEKKKAEAEAKGETFAEAAPEPVRCTRPLTPRAMRRQQC